MKWIITIISFFFLELLFSLYRLEAQVYLHIDRSKYIAGEDVWFSIYSVDPVLGKLSSKSSIAYIELINPWNRPLIQKRFQLTDGKGEGNFLLPDSISSGTYIVRAYTRWMENLLPDKCFIYEINVFNPFGERYFWLNTDGKGPSSETQAQLTGKKESKLFLETDSTFGRREKVSLKIRILNGSSALAGISDLSISVAPADVSFSSGWLNDFSVPVPYPKQIRFETNEHYLSGRIRYRESNTANSSHFLYMSVQGKVAEFDYAVIDTSGRFTFIMPLDNKSRNLILQPENANNNMILEIEPSFSRRLPVSQVIKESISDSLTSEFSELSFNYQAGKIYGTGLKKERVEKEENNNKKKRFYGIPEMEIFLDDYISLPVMQEVFFELVPGVLLRSIKSGYDVKIINPLTGNYYAEPPLVMIDGVIINDLTVLGDLNPEKVEKIEVVKTPYLIGDLVLHGIVNVITRSGDFSNITLPDYTVVLPYRVIDNYDSFIAPEYSDKRKNQERMPDLRNTLYWNPSIKTNSRGEAETGFWTSDLPGTYTINIRGITSTGEKVSLNKTFVVR
ncbi:MAG TPA: hypothetical protein DEO60_14030 [Bacteroidales bacterium]|nr:hypothetical protein [Bacteroidales bacterium]